MTPSKKRPLPTVLSVGELAKRAGVPVSTLHFYEAKGLIASERNKGNQRRYTRDVLRRLAIIRVAIDLGFSLGEILELLKPIPNGQRPTARDMEALLTGWRQTIDSRIRGLERLRDHLDRCIGCGCLSKDDCPLRNPNDHLGDDVAGAYYLQGE